MISSMSKGDEANREVSELKRACYSREREREMSEKKRIKKMSKE